MTFTKKGSWQRSRQTSLKPWISGQMDVDVGETSLSEEYRSDYYNEGSAHILFFLNSDK